MYFLIRQKIPFYDQVPLYAEKIKCFKTRPKNPPLSRKVSSPKVLQQFSPVSRIIRRNSQRGSLVASAANAEGVHRRVDNLDFGSASEQAMQQVGRASGRGPETPGGSSYHDLAMTPVANSRSLVNAEDEKSPAGATGGRAQGLSPSTAEPLGTPGTTGAQSEKSCDVFLNSANTQGSGPGNRTAGVGAGAGRQKNKAGKSRFFQESTEQTSPLIIEEGPEPTGTIMLCKCGNVCKDPLNVCEECFAAGTVYEAAGYLYIMRDKNNLDRYWFRLVSKELYCTPDT